MTITVKPLSKKCRLWDCPVGLFVFEDCLAVMTEYQTLGNRDAYIVESGEYFWGGTSEFEARASLMVTPCRTLVGTSRVAAKGRTL